MFNTEVMQPTSGVDNLLTEIKFVISAYVFDDVQDFQVSKIILHRRAALLNSNAADKSVLPLLYFSKVCVSRLFMG